MCWEFHGRDRVPLEDVGGTHGEDGGSREDHSPLGRPSGPPNRITSFKDHTRCTT